MSLLTHPVRLLYAHTNIDTYKKSSTIADTIPLSGMGEETYLEDKSMSADDLIIDASMKDPPFVRIAALYSALRRQSEARKSDKSMKENVIGKLAEPEHGSGTD